MGYYSLLTQIRDTNGRAQAIGSAVTISSAAFAELDSVTYDSLTIFGAEEGGGRTYDIRVTKTFYNDVVIRGVATSNPGCVTNQNIPGVMHTVPVVLTLATGAPAVRSVHILPVRALLDRGSSGPWRFTPWVDAEAGSRSVSWHLKGDTGSVTFDSTAGTLIYRCRPTSGYLTLTAVSTADSTVVGTSSIAVQGHPAANGDPPCS